MTTRQIILQEVMRGWFALSPEQRGYRIEENAAQYHLTPDGAAAKYILDTVDVLDLENAKRESVLSGEAISVDHDQAIRERSNL